MQQEYIAIADEIAFDCVSNQQLFDEVKQQIRKKENKEPPKGGGDKNNGNGQCSAGLLCCLDQEKDKVVLDGESSNGSLSCKCGRTFHNICLFLYQGNVYCAQCYKQHVVRQCPVDVLFADLLPCKEDGPKQTENNLVKYVDNFLKVHGMEMNLRQYYKWKDKCKQMEKELVVHVLSATIDGRNVVS